MFREILNIIPKLDAMAMATLERALSGRFGRVAKKFGQGLKSAILGGGILGLATGVITKLLNPLKETQDAIDKILKSADDVVTNAAQFNSTPGKLVKLNALAKSTGLEEGNLATLIQKFSGAVAEAKQDPNKQTSVRAFANDTDMVEAFYQFIQQLQKMDKKDQILVQQEVFGEKQILKMADFLQLNFKKQQQLIGAKPSDAYNQPLEKLAALNDLTDALEAKRELQDVITKGGIVNKGMVMSNDASKNLALERENMRIGSYEDIKLISKSIDRIMFQLEDGMLWFTKQLPMMGTWIEQGALGITQAIQWMKNLDISIKGITNSRAFRLFGGGKDK